MASLKGNIILNSINTITSVLFPIITFPYAARVLLPEGIGLVNFQYSIINYIVLLTSIGIPLYAVKEIAKCRDHVIERNRATIEIILLSLIICLIGYVAVWAIAKYIPQIHQNAELFYILSFAILFTAIGVDWFYKGIEDFKFITIRAVVIRILAAASLFLFVKDSNDVLIYGAVIVGSTVGNNFINFIHLRKYINLHEIEIKSLNIARHIKPALHIFILNLIISLYIQLNSIMLGFISGDESVGLFTAGTRITHVGLMLISSIGTVLLPRCSHLYKIGDQDGFSSVIKKSLRLTIGLSLPMMLGLVILAKPVTMIFCGQDYAGSIPVLYWNAPVVLFISLTNVLGIQILYAKDKINLVIASVTGGALINLLLNLFLIPKFGATGAAISTFFAELAVLLIQIIIGRHDFPFRWMQLNVSNYIVGSMVMGIGVYITAYILNTDALKLIVGLTIGVLIYMVFLTIRRDALCMELFKYILRK